MIEFFKNEKAYIISFSNCGQIIITDEDFAIEGDIAFVAVQFAKYLYTYSEQDSHTHPEIHQFIKGTHIISLDFGNIFKSYLGATISLFKNKDFNINIEWHGNPNSQWIEFKEIFDRYFSLKTFL